MRNWLPRNWLRHGVDRRRLLLLVFEGGATFLARAREALLKIHELAAAYFREQLAGPAGARARAAKVARYGKRKFTL